MSPSLPASTVTRIRTGLEQTRADAPGVAGLLDRLCRLGDVGLMGGAPRDWALGFTPRDLDLVVDASENRIARCLGSTAVERTSLGGFRLRLPTVSIDLWPMHRTWALTAGAAVTCLAELSGTTFLNAESLLLDVRRGTVHHRGFDALLLGQLHLVLAPNPSPAHAVARTLRLVQRTRAKLSRQLERYVGLHSSTCAAWRRVAEAQRARYGTVHVDRTTARRLT